MLCPLICLLLWAAPLHAQDGTERESRPWLTYDIEAKLDTGQHTLSGREHIRLQNPRTKPVEWLYFHLYLNAFRDERSVFMREGGTQLRGRSLGKPGSIRITALRTGDGADLTAGLETELVPGDATQARVRLPTPLQPGAALDLLLDFDAELPEIVARAGYAGEFHMVGQWFPKLAKLAPDASFVSFPYHGFGEFYADFADYTFRVTVPARYAVAGSGERIGSRVSGDLREDSFRSLRVHDVSWAAYPYFEHVTRKLGDVRLELYAPRGYGFALTRLGSVLAAALPFFAKRYGPYPYPTLTIIFPPSDAQAAAGMEYPTLFTTSGSWWALPTPWPDPSQDVVSVHELAHQWFSGMIASDELQYPVLDEGLAEWSALDFLRDYYARTAPWSARLQLPDGPFDVLRAAALVRTRKLPSSLLSADKYSERSLGAAIYARPALVLARIAELVGRPQLTAAVSRYARAQRFRHPAPEQLFAAFDATLGPEYGSRGLRKALDAGTVNPWPPLAAERTASPSGARYLPELWSLAYALLRGLGP
jgi:Peptidase family M1 domain